MKKLIFCIIFCSMAQFDVAAEQREILTGVVVGVGPHEPYTGPTHEILNIVVLPHGNVKLQRFSDEQMAAATALVRSIVHDNPIFSVKKPIRYFIIKGWTDDGEWTRAVSLDQMTSEIKGCGIEASYTLPIYPSLANRASFAVVFGCMANEKKQEKILVLAVDDGLPAAAYLMRNGGFPVEDLSEKAAP